VYKCSECAYTTGNKSNYNKHLLTHKKTTTKEPKAAKMYECPTCGHKTGNKSNYNKHLKTHENKPQKQSPTSKKEEKVYECIYCNYRTTDKSNYKKHCDTLEHKRKAKNPVERLSMQIAGHQSAIKRLEKQQKLTADQKILLEGHKKDLAEKEQQLAKLKPVIVEEKPQKTAAVDAQQTILLEKRLNRYKEYIRADKEKINEIKEYLAEDEKTYKFKDKDEVIAGHKKKIKKLLEKLNSTNWKTSLLLLH